MGKLIICVVVTDHLVHSRFHARALHGAPLVVGGLLRGNELGARAEQKQQLAKTEDFVITKLKRFYFFNR